MQPYHDLDTTISVTCLHSKTVLMNGVIFNGMIKSKCN